MTWLRRLWLRFRWRFLLTDAQRRDIIDAQLTRAFTAMNRAYETERHFYRAIEFADTIDSRRKAWEPLEDAPVRAMRIPLVQGKKVLDTEG
jgi:hypothetical protein